ncbi:MAG: MFS transporter [Eubacteriales bacterium]|nr:MFS transporter [Eubacteriales bacterium]
MKIFTNSNESNTSLGVAERLSYASGNFGSGLMATILSAFLLFFYTNYMHLSGGIVGIIFMIVRVSDGFTDLIMGNMVDRTKSKHGKARVWILRMCIPYALINIFAFTVPSFAPDAIKYIYVFATYLLASAVISTAMAVPYITMAALLTDNPYERGILGVFSMFSGTFSGMVVSATALKLVNVFGDNQMAWIITVAIYAITGILFELLCFFGTKERVLVGNHVVESTLETAKKDGDVKESVKALLKNKYWLMFIVMSFGLWMIIGLQSTATIYYCEDILSNRDAYSVLANAGNVAMLIFLMLSSFFMGKFGKVITFRIGMVCALVGTGVMMLFPTNMTVLIAGIVIRSAGSGLAGACMTGILADTLDFGEWKTGISAVGLGMAAYSACQKLGSGISAAIWGLLLQIGHYDGGAEVQSAAALNMIKTGYFYIPFAVAAVAFIMIMQFDLDKKHDQIHADLEIRRGNSSLN